MPSQATTTRRGGTRSSVGREQEGTMNRISLRSGRAVALVSALTAGLVGFPAAPAPAGFGIALRPGHADPNDPSTRAFFKPTVGPGETFADEVIVSNTGDRP